MALQYGLNNAVDFASSKIVSFASVLSRTAGQPMDKSQLWYPLDGKTGYERAAEYAATTSAYVGQELAVVDVVYEEDGKTVKSTSVKFYGIQDAAGTLKELGAIPVGDNKSVVVSAEGTISLKGVEALVFERDILGEDDQPTGEKETVQYQVLMTKDGLVWVEPSKTTVEGLATLLDALTKRVDTLEVTVNGKGEGEDRVEGLVDKVAANTKAIADEQTRAKDAEADLLAKINAIDFIDKDELDSAIETALEPVNESINTKAAQSDLEALKARVEAFLDNTGAATDAIDTLQELITYINEHDDVELTDIVADIQALQTKVDTGDKKVSEYVEAAINALSIGDYAKAADLTTLASRVETLEAKPFDTYATKAEVQDIDSELATKVDAATISHTSDGVEEGVSRDGTTLNIVVDAYKKSETYTKDEVNTAITNKIGEMTGGESAADVLASLNDYKKANDAEVYGSEKVASWTDAEGKYNPVYSQDSRIDTLAKDVVTAQTQADKGVADAAAAKGVADQNKIDLGTLQTNFENIVTKADSGLVAKVSALEVKDTELAGLINGIDATVKNHTTTITEHGTKITALENKDTELAALIQSNTAKFADYSTTDQMTAAIESAIAGADLSTYAKVTDVEAIYKAGVDGGAATGVLAEEIARATAAEKANADAIAALIGDDKDKTIRAIAAEETAAIVAGADTKYDTLKEIADFIMNDETGAAAMANDIAALKETVGDADSGLVKAVADNTAAIAAIIQPKTSSEVTVATDGTLGLGQVSTDKLVQGENTLIIDGGSAAE